MERKRVQGFTPTKPKTSIIYYTPGEKMRTRSQEFYLLFDRWLSTNPRSNKKIRDQIWSFYIQKDTDQELYFNPEDFEIPDYLKAILTLLNLQERANIQQYLANINVKKKSIELKIYEEFISVKTTILLRELYESLNKNIGFEESKMKKMSIY
jgi:hypothetical protein